MAVIFHYYRYAADKSGISDHFHVWIDLSMAAKFFKKQRLTILGNSIWIDLLRMGLRESTVRL